MTARLVSAYGKLAANNYLRVILTPILRRVYHLSEALEVLRHRAWFLPIIWTSSVLTLRHSQHTARSHAYR
jgi:hypothetical protein